MTEFKQNLVVITICLCALAIGLSVVMISAYFIMHSN